MPYYGSEVEVLETHGEQICFSWRFGPARFAGYGPGPAFAHSTGTVSENGRRDWLRVLFPKELRGHLPVTVESLVEYGTSPAMTFWVVTLALQMGTGPLPAEYHPVIREQLGAAA